MKILAVNREITLSILMMIVLICGLSGVSYGEDAITILSAECKTSNVVPGVGAGLADLTVKGTMRANRTVRDIKGWLTINGHRVRGANLLGGLSAGQTKSFSITEVSVRVSDGDRCGLSFEWTEEVNPQPEVRASGVCQVGDIIQPGESCTYPGTNDVFSVDDAGKARFLFFTAGGNLNIRNANINGKRYTLVTAQTAGGGRRITALGDTTAPPQSVPDSDPPSRSEVPPASTPGTLGTLGILTDFNGAPGEQKPVTVTATDPDGNPAPNVTVTLTVTRGGGTVSPSTVRTNANGTATSTLTRGNTPGNNYFVSAAATGYGQRSSRISISEAILPPDLVVDSPRVNTSTLAPGESFKFSVTVRNKGDGPASTTTLRYYRSSDRTRGTEVGTEAVSALASNATSNASIQLTAPTAPGTYTYSACVSRVSSESNTDNNCTTPVRITVQSPPEELVISSGNNQNGTLNSQLTDPLVVQVLDADGNGVVNVKVTFRITAGQGSLSSRGNRRVVVIQTNSHGFAEAPFTPTSAGTATIEASVAALDPVTFTITVGEPPAKLLQVSGDNQSGKPGTRLANPFVVEVQDKDSKPVEGVQVTFRVTTGGGKLSATMVTTGANGRAQTFLTLGTTRTVNKVRASVSGIDTPVTFSTSIEPKVLIVEARRPPMYWIDADAGTLHRLVGAKVENLLPNVRNAMSLAVDMANGKLYWTEKTGERTGRIRRANLDGSNVQLVKDLTSVPIDITLDMTGGELYLMNTWGKIQRLSVDGSNFQPNLITDLEGPKHLTLDTAGGKVYWTEQTSDRTGRIRRANLDGSNVEDLVTGLDSPVGIALDIAGGKMYWVNANAAKIQRANLNGSNVEDLVTGLDSPVGIALDIAGGKMYWADANAAKIQRADLDGSNLEDLVTGLYFPAEIVISTPSQVIPLKPDLVVEAVHAQPATVAPGQTFRLYATLKNNGAGKSTSTTLRYYRSTDAVISTADTQLGRANRDPLAANATIRRYRTVTSPTTPGTYYYGVCVDSVTDESDTANNCSRAVSVTVTAPTVVSEDVNDDGVVDVQDLVYVTRQYGQTGANSADVNDNGVVNIDDVILVAAVLDADAAAAPSLYSGFLETFTAAEVKLWLSQARQRDFKDPSVRRGIQFLEQLLASIVPKETALLANYPNPFNPETWIPYQLSKPADVMLTIYAVNGHLVRRLVLGHQVAGMYQTRSRAAYWDGRNAFGESVASGVYFYVLTAGDFTATRKMLILK